MSNMSGSKEGIPELEKQEDVQARRTSHLDLCQEICDLNRQVRMMSDSLAACKQMSKRRHMNGRLPAEVSSRPHQTTVEVAINTSVTYKCVSRTTDQIPVKEEKLQIDTNKKSDKSTIISYMVPNNVPNFEKTQGIVNKLADPYIPEFYLDMLGVNWNKFEKPVEKPSLIKLYKHEDIDPMKMMDLILRELNILKELEPRVTLKITKLLNTVMHFRECAKCNKRFQDILPQILNRVQNLIKYVRKKSGKHYVWPNEYSYLRLTPNLPHACGIEEETQADEEKLEPIELGRLEKLDVSLVDDTPGVQISLLVEPEKADKRFYERVTSRVPDDLAAKEVFPIFHPQELVYNLVVVVLRSSSRTELHCKRKQGIFRARGFALAVGLISAVPWTKVFVAAVRAPVDSAVRFGIVGVVSYLRCVAPFEERTLVYTSNSVNSFDRLRDCQREICQKGFSDEVVPFRSTSSFGDDQDLIEDFLAAANEEDMEKVKDIEVEVKGLKDLMLEVHRNQIELSKVLLEKGVYSQPIVKLTDPRMLDEENRAVKNAAQFEVAKGSTSSETLQVAVDELKKKCDVKNRMILTLLRGLRSNVPKEWWEELVDCIFSETKPIEEFDSERVNEFIRQTSLYLMNGKEASITAGLESKQFQSESLAEGSVALQAADEMTSPLDMDPRNLGKRDDFPEVINKMRQQLLEQTERLTMSDPKETSSFIEKILQEDSQAGVAVVDLFVAVKRAKDKLNQLTEFNNEACQKMNVLKRDSTFMKINYQELVGSINDLYEKINDAAKQWVTGLPKAQDEKGAITQVSKSEDIKTEFISPDCSMSGDLLNSLITLQRSEGPLVDGKEQNRDKGDEEVASSQEKMKCSMCSKRSLIKQPSEKINQHTVHIINTVLEDMVAALVVNTLRQKLINNGSTGAEEESQNDKTYTTLDICQLLTNVGPEKVTEVTIESQRELCTEQMCSANCQVNGLLAGAGVCSKKLIDKGKEIGKNILGLRKSGRQLEESGENLSEEDSLFEEAMAEPVPDERTFTSANCMGDLTGNVNKKSVSTLTSNTGVETSWIGKITEEIKSKFWNLKPNFKRDFASPSNEEEEEEEKKLSPLEGVKFTINTGTPTGVFDVTVKQLKQYRSNSDNNDSKCCVSTAFQENSKLSSKMKDSEYYWSHESFEHSDSDGLSRMDSTSGGEGEDMEEFIEIYVHKNKGNSKDHEAIVTVEKGMSLETTIKQKILPLFEIEKCQPKYFVQEILPKHPQNEKIVMATSSKGNLQRGFGRSVKESDIVIYIQVEVDGEDIDDPKQIFIECNSSLDDLPINVESVTDQKSTEVNTRTLEEMRCPVTLLRCNRPREEETGSETIKIDEPEREIYSEMADDQTVFVKEPKKKSVTFLDENGETVQEQLIAEILPDDEEGEPEIGRNWDSQVSVKYLYNEMKANIRDMPRHYGHILRMDPKQNIQYVCYGFIETEAPELKTALDLIREIETNVVDVKLNDAIMILPNLEAELRKHLQCKMKVLSRDQSFGDSLQDFYSAVDFWPEDASDSESVFDSEERLYHLFALLSDLEGAVKGKVTSTADIGPCQQNSSRIYELLHALTQSIKDLETTTNMTNLAETVNIASQLDTAVREYDTIVKSADCKGVDNGNGKLKEKKSWVEVSVKEHMRNVRRNVFQTVEGEAIKTESRIDRDFDRIDRLERENEEAMNFVDAFLKKMIRRTEEVDDLKKELRDLSLTLEEYYRGAVKHKEVEKSKQGTMECHSQVEEEKKQEKEVVQMETLNEETVRNTISGLLSALNKLKARAKEKNEACKEILESVNQNSSIPAAKTAELDRNNSRSSRSSFTAKTTDDLFSILKEFRRIGDTSLYMAWSKPEGALSALVVGYEITVNGHVNQKVRNPQRTQAVLYSVDLSQKAEIQLFGIIENGTKILLSSVTHYDT